MFNGCQVPACGWHALIRPVLHDGSRRILARIIAANDSRDRGPVLAQLRQDLEWFKVLARLCQESLQHDPFAGAVFVFRNRKATAVKLLMYDGQGFWLCHKRISRGRFPWWPSATDGAAERLAAHQLAVLLSAGDPTRTGAAADWRPVGPPA